MGRPRSEFNPGQAGRPGRPAPSRSPTLRGILIYHRLERFSEWIIYFMVVFSPWAYGTTQRWSMGTLNVLGYTSGLLLFAKFLLRKVQHYAPPRWDDPEKEASVQLQAGRIIIIGLGIFTVLILGYCLTAALNARSTYTPAQMSFAYHSHLAWLPHSYDRNRSWQYFANYLALACFFWAVRDWVLGKTESEARADRVPTFVSGQTFYLPARLRRLLWVLGVNGALLAIESVAQRFSDTNKLLWLTPTRENPEADSQFGPYAYRSNAAQYFNMVWPVTLAFWWMLRREVRHRLPGNARRAAYHLLLVAVLIMAACPILTLSRGGALVAFGNLVIAAVILVFAMRRRHALTRFGMVLFFAAAAATGLWFGWDKLGERLKYSEEGIQGREAMFQTARKIATDYPVYGTGPGTFEPVFQLYRSSLEEYWPAQLHNDWLETRITFGWVGSALIAVAFLLAVSRWFARGGIQTNWPFPFLLWMALGGCLVHALYDFPLQIYSVLLVFLLICAVLTTLGRQN